jgi:hypothetical protein
MPRLDKRIIIIDILIVICVAYGTWLMLTRGDDGTGLISSGLENLKYYTVLSNLFCGIVALAELVAHISRKSKFDFTMLKFMAATVTGLTAVIIAAFLQPTYPDLNMYQGSNLWFHLIVPVIAVAECVFTSDVASMLSFGRTMLTMIPSAVYGLFYAINILIRGVGTWPDTNDWYGFLNWGWPVGIIIFLVIILVTWLVSLALWLMNNLWRFILLAIGIIGL